MPSGKVKIKRAVTRTVKMLTILFVCYLLLYLYLRLTKEPWRCPRVERIFLNEKYDVERCEGGGGDYHYFVRMRIYSKGGELLAQRRFTVDTDFPGAETEYWDDKIIYDNAIRDSEGGAPGHEKGILQFPLTRKDWFDANLDRILFSP